MPLRSSRTMKLAPSPDREADQAMLANVHHTCHVIRCSCLLDTCHQVLMPLGHVSPGAHASWTRVTRCSCLLDTCPPRSCSCKSAAPSSDRARWRTLTYSGLLRLTLTCTHLHLRFLTLTHTNSHLLVLTHTHSHLGGGDWRAPPRWYTRMGL